MNWRRASLGIAGAAVVVIVAGALALHAPVDPARLRAQAIDMARSKLSRDLAIGSLTFKLLPRPTFLAEDVALANPPWAKERTLIHADHVSARLALLPLLVGMVRLQRLALDGAQVNLEVAPDGAASWDVRPAGGSAAPKPASAGDWLRLNELEVSNADIHYRPKPGVDQPWHVEKASVESSLGLRNVRVDARATYRRHPLHATARFADLASFGAPGAATEAAIALDWGKTRVSADGRLPLHRDLEGAAFKASLESESLEDMLAFFGVEHRRTAPLRVHAELSESHGEVDVRGLDVTLGKHRMTGDAQVWPAGAKPRFAARLQSDRLDWVRALLDAGSAPYPPLAPEELFYDRPFAWPLLVAMKGKEGTVDVKLGAVLLRNGVELRNATAHAVFEGDLLHLKPFTAELLGGSATGAMDFDGSRKQVHVDVTAKQMLLERWLRERHRSNAFTGGPMKIRAVVTATGNSMKQLAASMTGPVSIAMGPGLYASQVAGDWEARMVHFSKKESTGGIEFECVAAALPFVNGRAKGEHIVGARSRESRLLTSGDIDFRSETLDLRGAVQPKPDEGVGLSTIAGDIMIAGPMRKMKVKLDPASTPGVIAKAGAAIATLGLSAAASAAANSSTSRPDPCDAVFTPQHPARP